MDMAHMPLSTQFSLVYSVLASSYRRRLLYISNSVERQREREKPTETWRRGQHDPDCTPASAPHRICPIRVCYRVDFCRSTTRVGLLTRMYKQCANDSPDLHVRHTPIRRFWPWTLILTSGNNGNICHRCYRTSCQINPIRIIPNLD